MYIHLRFEPPTAALPSPYLVLDLIVIGYLSLLSSSPAMAPTKYVVHFHLDCL
jgi:hypothetical protein